MVSVQCFVTLGPTRQCSMQDVFFKGTLLFITMFFWPRLNILIFCRFQARKIFKIYKMKIYKYAAKSLSLEPSYPASNFTPSHDWNILCSKKKAFVSLFLILLVTSRIGGHFTVMDGSEAGVDFVLIQTFLLYYANQVILMLTSIFQNNFHNKAKEVCIKTRSPSASHSLEGQGTNCKTVKWATLSFTAMAAILFLPDLLQNFSSVAPRLVHARFMRFTLNYIAFVNLVRVKSYFCDLVLIICMKRCERARLTPSPSSGREVVSSNPKQATY